MFVYIVCHKHYMYVMYVSIFIVHIIKVILYAMLLTQISKLILLHY